jgi:hypothetical protein
MALQGFVFHPSRLCLVSQVAAMRPQATLRFALHRIARHGSPRFRVFTKAGQKMENKVTDAFLMATKTSEDDVDERDVVVLARDDEGTWLWCLGEALKYNSALADALEVADTMYLEFKKRCR